MGLVQRDPDYHTYGDYVSWPEDFRYELIDGTAYLMAPAPTRAHQDVAGEIYFQLRNALQNKPCRGYIAPLDVRLPKAEESDDQVDTVVQPDVLVVCDHEKLDHRGVRGAPDFVVEVLSPATASHDHQRKRQAYERAGVREYWLVHPIDRIITIYRLEGGKFGKPEVTELLDVTPVVVLPGIRIHWETLLTVLPRPD